MAKSVTIHGIPCYVSAPPLVIAVEEVLGRVSKNYSDDLARLVKSMRAIRPLAAEDAEDGTLGWWRAEKPTLWEHRGWGITEPTPGTLYVLDDASMPHGRAVALIAHELGHAATMDAELEARGDCPSDEWRSELTADWFAYRWGFGRQIAAERRHRDEMHHCFAPGSTFEDLGRVYKLTRSFRVRAVSPA